MRALIGAATVLLAFGTSACGEEESGPAGLGGGGERLTVLVVRSIEQTSEGSAVISEALRAVDPETGASTKLAAPSFAGGDAQFATIYTGRRLVFRCASGACVLDPETGRPPRTLGDGWCMTPSQTEGRVWVARLDPESPETVRAVKSVREVSVDGEVTVPDSRLPRGRWQCPLGAVSSGLLFADEDPHRLVVWSPQAGKVVATLPGAFPAATDGDLVAWCPLKCERGLHLTDVSTHEDELVALEDPFVFAETYEGAFSPDGSMLAVPVSRNGSRGDRRVALVDVEGRRARVVEAIGGVGSFVWSRDGRELFTIAGRATLAAYDPDSGDARTIELKPPTTILSLVGG